MCHAYRAVYRIGQSHNGYVESVDVFSSHVVRINEGANFVKSFGKKYDICHFQRLFKGLSQTVEQFEYDAVQADKNAQPK